MHRVLPGCTYGRIPKVQGPLDVHFVSPVPNCLGAACAFHRKDTVSRGEQTVRHSAPRAVKCHIACSAFVTRCIEAMLRASGKKTVGYCSRTQVEVGWLRRDRSRFSEPASRHLSDAIIATLPRCNK